MSIFSQKRKIPSIKQSKNKKYNNYLFPHKQPFSSKKFFLILSLVISTILVLTGYFYLFSFSHSIKQIDMEGIGETNLTQEIYNKINDQLKRKRYCFFPQSNVYFFDKTETIQNISQILAYKNIEITLDGNNNLKIIIDPRTGALYWANNQGVFIIDNNGVVINKLSDSTATMHTDGPTSTYNLSLNLDNNFFPLIYDNTNQAVDVNQTLLTADFIAKIINLNDLLKQTDLIDIISFETNNLLGSEITANTTETWQIYFNLNNDFEKQINRLNVLLKNKLTATNRKNLQYIDLKNEEKVFYK